MSETTNKIIGSVATGIIVTAVFSFIIYVTTVDIQILIFFISLLTTLNSLAYDEDPLLFLLPFSISTLLIGLAIYFDLYATLFN